MKTGLHIGNMREKEEYVALADAMLKILHSGQEQKTIRKALDVLSELQKSRSLIYQISQSMRAMMVRKRSKCNEI